ncbi:MAG: transglutaminase domain-containing protein [Clostridia bacterium]|nr:transglutaminase domain-containing protein [Clostridia bacterium]NCC68292.1 transglutaminase domain-containing protein [Clostridia bacterium]
MLKKLVFLILAAALMASASGCASIYEKEYFSASSYEDADESADVTSEGVAEVNNYFRLKLEISKLISAHQETGTINFRDYSGNVYDDIASACKDISTNTAIGDYCVDYISYDIVRIVAYYEANVYISYKRTEEETSEIITISTSDGLNECISDALSELQESLVVMVNASMIGGEEARGYVEAICMQDPLLCVYKPVANVNVYSGSGIQKIFEFNFDYGGSEEELLGKRTALSDAVEEIAAGITAESDAYRAFQAANMLVESCVSDESAGDTAYSAIIDGAADSEGMAMAFSAVCAAAGISCRVVVGRLNSEQHYWNMIEADGSWYHLDVSRALEDGFAVTFLQNDSYMWDRYWWDTEMYPICDGTLTYSAVVTVEQNT